MTVAAHAENFGKVYEGGLAQDGLRAFFQNHCERMGVEWSERFGDFLVARVLISYSSFVSHYRRYRSSVLMGWE